MKVGPKYKIAKRLGASVFEKTQTQKFALASERRAKTKGRGRGPTEYGKQLLEKQKVRTTYGLTERQFSRYVRESLESNGKDSLSPADKLHQTLELRLDNIVARMGLASTRRAARQMVSHGHITVNGRKTTIPSRQITSSDKIGVRAGSKGLVLFEGISAKLSENAVPSWLTFDTASMEGGIVHMPTKDSANTAGDLVTVLSFYSR